MGKNKDLKSLGKVIGNIAIHKALIEHTNKPESKEFLKKEILAYRDSVIKKYETYHWNSKDKEKIKEQAIAYAKKKRSKKYFDTGIIMKDIEDFVLEMINELDA